MKFDLVGWLTNPFVLMFVAVFTGLMFGKIKFGKFNFGISGTLFTGLIFGWIIYKYGIGITENQIGYESAQNMIKSGVVSEDFFHLFLILFVASVGLLASKDIGVVLKKFGTKFILLGIAITFMGAFATYGMTLINSDASPYEVSGVYTGALTSSPGLAAAIETAKDHASNKVNNFETQSVEEKKYILKNLGIDIPEKEIENYQLTDLQKKQFINDAKAGIGVGHAIGYPFGVIVVIFAVNFFPKIFGINVEQEHKKYILEMQQANVAGSKKEIKSIGFNLISFVIACFCGYTVGKFKINLGPLGDFSLGSTGGVLICSLILGYIGKIGLLNFRMNNNILGTIRQLSLAFFLAVVGLRYGFMLFDTLAGPGAYLALVGLVVGIVAMLTGFFIGKYAFKINWIMLSGAICGGMTSTPGLGAAIDAVGSDEPAAGYGATYPFALLGVVIFTIILHNLPM